MGTFAFIIIPSKRFVFPVLSIVRLINFFSFLFPLMIIRWDLIDGGTFILFIFLFVFFLGYFPIPPMPFIVQGGPKVLSPQHNIVFYFRGLTRTLTIWKRGLG